MSERIYINDRMERKSKFSSNRSLLSDVSIEDTVSLSERDMLLEYQNTLLQLRQKEQELQDIRELLRNIYASNNKDYLTVQKELQGKASTIASQIDAIDHKLIDLEQNCVLKNVIDRERTKAFQIAEQRAEERRKEDIARAKERAEQTQRELIARYQESRQKAIQKREQANVQPKQEITSETQEQPKQELQRKSLIESVRGILPSIPFSILGLFEFYIIYGLTILAIALVFWVLSFIPILNTLVDWLFRIREDTPDMFAMILAATLSYLGTTATANHIVNKTRKLTLMLAGIYMVVLNIIFLIVNVINGDAILANIVIGIAGIVMYHKSKNE